MPFTFEIRSGRMFAPNGSLAGTGYSGGDLGKVPEAINNPEFESQKNIGPLPEGWYTFGELVLDHPKLGHYVFPLIPDAENHMDGRSGFWCHGDSFVPRAGSEGCIVMPYATRQAMYGSADHRLQVVGLLAG